MNRINDKKIALLELRRDPLFHKIPFEKQNYYVESSIEIGKKSAIAFKGKDLRSLFQENKITLSINQRTNIEKKFQVRAEFIQKEGNNEVILYEDSLRQLEKAWNESPYNLKSISYSVLENIHLAHEFHHFLEYTVLSPVKNQLESVITKSLFGKERKHAIRQTSEIASHAFAKELTDFEYFPTLLDIVYLNSIGEIEKETMESLLT